MAATVESVLGVSEEELVQMNGQVRGTLVAAQGGAFVHRVTRRQTPTGQFTCPSVGQLRAAVHTLVPRTMPTDDDAAAHRVPLELLVGMDVAALQASLTTPDRAMVQVASNFNCLEGASEHVRPDCGFLVDSASTDLTQGPAAVFCTLSAYLWRVHFCMTDGPVPAPGMPTHGQAAGRGVHGKANHLQGARRTAYYPQTGGMAATSNINLLKDVREFCGVPITGKLRLTGDERLVPNLDDEDDDDEGEDEDDDHGHGHGLAHSVVDGAAFVDRVRVGLHTDCPVLFGRNGRRVIAAAPERAATVVDHVLSASLDMRRPGFPLRSAEAEALRVRTGNSSAPLLRLCRGLLRAAYEGAYLAAIARRRRVLYLTLVGGGSFGNPLPLIAHEVARAHRLFAGLPQSRMEHVVLCVFSRGQADEMRRLLAASSGKTRT